VIDIAVQVGLRDLELADVPRRLRPDHRFALLQRNPVDWEAVSARLDEILGGDPRWSQLHAAPGVTAEMFSPRLSRSGRRPTTPSTPPSPPF
jgi:hypothetical protein